MGFSHHHAQILCIHSENPKGRLVTKKKRQFTEEIIEEFKYLLHKESWQAVFVNSETNTKFNVFVDTIIILTKHFH